MLCLRVEAICCPHVMCLPPPSSLLPSHYACACEGEPIVVSLSVCPPCPPGTCTTRVSGVDKRSGVMTVWGGGRGEGG